MPESYRLQTADVEVTKRNADDICVSWGYRFFRLTSADAIELGVTLLRMADYWKEGRQEQ